MTKPIRRVAVIGAGVMGSGIAAHFANSGIETILLDIVPPNLTDDEKKSIQTAQHAAYKNTFLTSGMTNSQFVGILNKISAEGARRTAELAASFA